MPDYKTMYFTLFNVLTEALREMDVHNYGRAAELLIQAQIEGERLCIEAD